ncbi:hypothetical protein ACNOYE_19465 [Nannocystaceae bacterium ST9]
MSTLQACDTGVPGCDLSCPADGILEGNATITGVAEVDAFFGAIVDVSAAANGISGTLNAEIDAIGISLGLEPGAGSAAVKTALEAKFSATIEGGLKIDFQPPRCEASIDVAVSAAAECDAEVDPGSATVECQGGCEVEGGVMASCEGDATLTCTGTAPNFMCSGSCEGDCELDVAASCEGTCRGTCNGECSVVDGSGNCAGECMGDCQGTCELKAGGSCSGSCTGSCTYEPGMAGCQADASAKCEAGASGSVQCDGRCEGEVTPPSVKAECEATVEAKADASVECFPPSLEVTWQWKAGVNAEAQAEFKAWLQGFKGHIGVMLAARAKADILIEALGNLQTAGTAAIEASGDTLANGDFVASFKLLTCGIPELENVGTALGGATSDLEAGVSGSIDIFAAVGM